VMIETLFQYSVANLTIAINNCIMYDVIQVRLKKTWFKARFFPGAFEYSQSYPI
jgi:hypothetical protein